MSPGAGAIIELAISRKDYLAPEEQERLSQASWPVGLVFGAFWQLLRAETAVSRSPAAGFQSMG